MEIIKVAYPFLESVNDISIACIGYFDGLHIGHQKLIKKTLQLANQENCIPACICFDKDPWEVIHHMSNVSHIVPIEERIHQFKELGIKRLFMLQFDEKMMNLSKEAFIQEIIKKLNLKTIICGNDFHFAKKGEGSHFDLEKELNVYVVDTIMQGNIKISSSNIEKMIQYGNIEEANTLLYKPYQIKGTIIHGNRKGSTILGFPTANLHPLYEYIIPKNGVYLGYVIWKNHKYKAMINIGHNPTMNFKQNTSMEAYIFDFNKDIYNKIVYFEFHKYIREEKKFNNIEELIQQLNKDKQLIQQL